MRSSKFLIFLLTLVGGIILLSPYLGYQPMLSQGDHGRDLYAFAATMNGEQPYHDYWWVYGPLMPYYYAAFLKLFGVSINSILLGKMVLNLLAGTFFFATLSLFIPGIFACIGTLWFWVFKPEFFFTYNHIGGITALLATTYFLCLYIHNAKIKYLYAILLSLFILSLIKINFGIITLLTVLASVTFFDKYHKIGFSREKGHFYIITFMVFPFLLLLIYSFFLRGLPLYAIRQCLPYLVSDHPHNASLWLTFRIWWEAIFLNINTDWANRFFALFLITSIIHTFKNLKNNKTIRITKSKIFTAIILFIVLYIANSHEYLVSGVIYRTYWAKPFSILLIFLFIGFTLQNFSKLIQVLLVVTLFAIIFSKFSNDINIIKERKFAGHLISIDKTNIVTNNPLPWIATVKSTTEFIDQNIPDEENFFALPYDPLYYFFSNKKSPIRQLIFFEHINIPHEQEVKIINKLEQEQINYILLSSRMNSKEAGLGIFGETYCPLLNDYIQNNFSKQAAFGDWTNPPGWGWHHGTMILKRDQ